MRRSRTTTALALAGLVTATAVASQSHASVGETAKASEAALTYVPDEPLPIEPVPPQQSLDGLGISGYPDRLSVRPGESVKIMVSTKAPTFTSSIVRVTHGDADPTGPGLKEQVIDSPVNKTYPGADQRLPLGSYVTVPDDRRLNPSGDFTITAWIAPSTIPGSPYNRTALKRTPVGTPRLQGLVTKWSEADKRGYGLFIDEQGAVALRLGTGDGRAETITTGVKLKPWAAAMGGPEAYFINRPRPQHVNSSGWYFVAASYEARSRTVTVTQQPVSTIPDDSGATVTTRVNSAQVRPSNDPLLMAAYWNRSGDAHPTGFYNGKIESPAVYGRALSADELKAIGAGKGRNQRPVAAWDFSRDMSGDHVADGGQNRLDGRAVNLPVRALTSHDWDRKTMDYHQDPRQWGAMHFHEDDLGDAGWKPAFTWKVPENARSGVYAARLEAAGKVYHATFVVRPKKATAKIAMLVPTLTYLAYGRTGASLSQYSTHADGSGYVYSSHRRPIDNLRPLTTGPTGAGRPWAFEADTHIFDWLETKKYEVDYITDHDVDREGRKILDPYRTVITGTHPEYISTTESEAIKGWLGDGGRLMYLGGNGFYWVTALDRARNYTELRRHDGTEAWQAAPGEYYHNTDGEYGGLWRFRGTPPQELIGVGFTAQGFGHPKGSADYNRPFDRTEASYSEAGAWVFEGVTKKVGIGGDLPSLQSQGGPMGEEVDRVDYSLGTPANTILLGRSQPFGEQYMHVVEEINTSALFEGGDTNPMVRGDITLMHYPNGGAVFSASSMVWSGGFFSNNYVNDMTRITENVLNRFTSGAPLPGAQAR
ncbi:large subunit of N,N-dimethylformamidase [Sphaerisporangium krabiense]|uniref:N,N-dimethylformamidase n=1 Tax=Sphaerisporangium krabiense TaxID=763782 RepID=A0A7W8Z765_9ACTN|nr:LamG domain-containing protein [Sphaerisporangium krabiense]MBB5628743.1 N,N-dimethylformamidase [Sphaerisporangium krabiense]GII60419.1 large subunit of N,N-dimethylformamidase [Sphaerisporangium krabiense]